MPMKKSLRPMRRPEADESTTRAMTPSMRPRMRPEDLEERMELQRMRDRIEMGNRQDPGPMRREMEMGFKKGGKVDGFPDLNKDGEVTKADVLRGRGVEGFAKGGMVTGSRAQISGTKFSGTF